MPTRIPHNRLSSSLTLSKSPLCSQCLRKLKHRQLSTTPQLRTRQRAQMFRWLNGPGDVFRHPLPNSTNYLNAYDKSGGLIRAQGAKPRDETYAEAQNKDPADNLGIDDSIKDEVELDTEIQSPTRRGVQRAAKKDRKLNEGGEMVSKDIGLPKEEAEDLMPFPMNRQFRSQPVLSEELREEIHKRVMVQGQDIRTVSASLNVEMRRVAAVVRLKAVEGEWLKEGKPLAIPYAKAMLGMLPQTPYVPASPVTHESINDLPVHSATTLQMFHPTSESRHFTRTDAGHVFDRTLLPAEKRIPHAELVEIQQWYNEGLQREDVAKLQRKKIEGEERIKKEKERVRAEKERLLVKKAETPRWEFRFRDISVENVGKDGRDRRGVGARYGMPHEDRKKGQIKIPTRVD
ncbi:MAG: hypothetical protein Q9217_002876 [Psora testacea]